MDSIMQPFEQFNKVGETHVSFRPERAADCFIPLTWTWWFCVICL